MPGGAGPFQTPIDYLPIRKSWRVAQDSTFQQKTTFGPFLQPFYKTTKFLAYLAIEGAPTAFVAAKLVAYVLMEPAPLGRFQQEWPNPLLPRRLRVQGEVWGSGMPSGIPPTPLPFAAVDVAHVARRSGPTAEGPAPLSLALLGGAVLPPGAAVFPELARRPRAGEAFDPPPSLALIGVTALPPGAAVFPDRLRRARRRFGDSYGLDLSLMAAATTRRPWLFVVT